MHRLKSDKMQNRHGESVGNTADEYVKVTVDRYQDFVQR